MAGYKSGQVNVGALLNPTEGLSRSLNQLSDTYGRQAALEQRQRNLDNDREFRDSKEKSRQERLVKQDAIDAKTRAENLVFRNAQENRAQKNFDVKEQQRLGQQEFNRAAAGYNPNTAKYTLDALDPEVAKDISRGRKLISGAQSDFLNFAKGDGSDKSLKAASDKYGKYLDASGNLTHTDKLRELEKYEEGLKGTRAQLKTLDDKGKKDLIDRISHEKFGTRLKAIDKDISSGRYLVKADKVKSFISQLPRSITDNVPYDTIYKTIANQTGGITAKDLTDAEAIRVKDLNKANQTVYSRSMTAVNAARKPSGKTGATLKGSDLVKGDSIIDAIDIGSSDNKRARLAYKDMMSLGINPLAAATTIKQSIDYGFWDDAFVGKDDDIEGYNNIVNLAKAVSNQMSGSSGSSGRGIPGPASLNVEVARDLPTIRRQGIKFKGDNTRIRDMIKPEILESLRGYNLSPELIIPDKTPAESTSRLPQTNTTVDEAPSASNNFYRDVPLGDNETMSPEEVEWNRKRSEEYSSLGSQVGRVGRDAMNLVNRLPASSAVGALNLLKAGNLGTKAVLPALTKNSRAVRSATSRKLADEARDATVAAKQAAMNPTRQVVKPTTRSASDLRVDAARKKVWNNDKIAKETTDMWDNYWMANVKN